MTTDDADAYREAFRTTLALTTATLAHDPEHTLSDIVDGLCGDLEATEPRHLIAIHLTITHALLDLTASANSITAQDAWQLLLNTANDALDAEETP
ncbi:hypothetical protein [Streptomyces sp. NRRL S-118]|uniref:hypothetical protein n=1 Tax=Streptomyces sp. NRRL S-118 TaxID=1463881 RepID=UPI0004C94B78|nr:hypothetical protein [Streptomyces sp. NRRL S-118]